MGLYTVFAVDVGLGLEREINSSNAGNFATFTILNNLLATKNNSNDPTAKNYSQIDGSKSHVLLMIKIRQKGLCRQCMQRITVDDDIVSRGHNSRNYYHKDCAKKLNII